MNKGKLSIAANEFTCLYLLPVVAQFRRLYPRIKVTVHRSLASRIPDEVLKHGAELGVISFNPDEELLRSVVVYRDQLAFVVYPNHPLASAQEVSIRQLGAESFVAHNVASPYREKVLQAFKRHKTPLNMDVELPTIDAIKKFVAHGNGVALVPSICVEGETKRGELVQIKVKELSIERKLRLIYRKTASLSHAGQAFLTVAETTGAEPGGRYLFQMER
jgi:DNA-binding transcriptional LysR family regulator